MYIRRRRYSELASSTILAKYPDSDPRLPMLQIAKERYWRVQLTELYKMRPEPKKGRTLIITQIQVAVRTYDIQLELHLLRLTGWHSVHFSDPEEAASNPPGQVKQLSDPDLPVSSLYVPIGHCSQLILLDSNWPCKITGKWCQGNHLAEMLKIVSNF